MNYKILDGKLIEFYTKDNFILQGFLTVRNKKNIIISIPGMTGNFYRNMIIKMEDYFLKAGYDIFSINTTGHDTVARVAKTKGRKVVEGTALERFEESAWDIKAAVDVCASLKYKNIILLGHSTGCQKATYYMYKTKDRRIKSLVLLSPSDDYNYQRNRLKKKWKKLELEAARLSKTKKKNVIQADLLPDETMSSQRFNSVSSLKRVESRLFDYDGPLKEFSSVKIPILAVFGSKDFSLVKPAKVYLDILERKTKSIKFNKILIKNADHTFPKHEKELTLKVIPWLNEVKNG